jgi:hypothetical protein
MFTTVFWKDALERAIKTVAQTLLALWLVGDVALDALSVDWGQALGVALGAAILSILSSIVSAGAVKNSVSPASLVTPDPNDVP